MNDAVLVGRFHTFGNLFGDFDYVVDCKWTTRDAIGQRFTFDEFEYEKASSRHFLEAVDARDVGVRQGSEQFRFPFEAREAFGIQRECGRQRFDRDIATQTWIARAEHFTHAAGAERGDNLKGADPGSGIDFHSRDCTVIGTLLRSKTERHPPRRMDDSGDGCFWRRSLL